ncbi:ATP-binding protein [Candidatus Poribacteria bacterium]|nr:ATP-binding protein [Candidatus Poribacteria bacterium]
MRINREKLLNDLQDFASRGNGVIIGSPGVGKTYLLKELRRSLKSAGIPHLLLPIDQLGDGTNEDLQRELSYEGDLIEKLKSVPVSHKKATLLFDAFDAARNEQTRKCFLRLIGRAIQELNGLWNVVVTVRTYDAKKSQELLDLFGSPSDDDLTQYHSKGILCRHFTIPPLNEDEIRQAFDQIPHLESIYNSGSQDFKHLLANPFNLWLLERILKTSQHVPDFSQIHSEVQLLGLFWQRRIEAANNELDRLFVLTQVARWMVNERSLTVRQDDVYEDLCLDKPARRTAWDNLLSDEILAKVSSTGQRIAFSHNILFDYAISVLLIEDDPRQLETFVLEDPSRPLFLRPSLTYFFTRLWYDAPESFWKAFWHVLPSNQSVVHLRLFARLIPTSVIANEAHDIAQLTPLLDKLQNREEIANEAMKRLLQALHALQIERDILWSVFFDRVSTHLHADFAWDLATLTSDIVERSMKTENTSVIHDACGRVARRLLGWVWQERKTSDDDWYNRLGSYWAVPLVAKTYGTNVDASRTLLEKVLVLTQEDNFPINFLTWLTEHIDKIWSHDPEFVVSTYLTVFTHYETSDEKTNIIGGFILPLTSTRRQDYSMCQYRLVKHFPSFLRVAPQLATQAAIRSLNFFIIRAHIAGYVQESVTLEDLIETFEFRGNTAHYVPDDSYMFDEQEYRDEPIKMADELFRFIVELASSQSSLPLLDSLLDVFRDNVWVAFFWKRLLKTAAQFPKVFTPLLFELCIAKPIQMGADTLHELGLFLESAASEFTPDQLRQIEETIMALSGEATDEDNHEFLERRRNRLLASIPQDLLQTKEAKEIREDMERVDRVPENRPLVSSSSWSEAYSEEKWLQEQGVDTTTPENQELQRFFGPLDKFKSDWLNDDPTEEAAESILPRLQEADTTINRNTEADKEVIDSLWYKLTACVAILSRVADNPESNLFAFCRQVLLHGATHELPKPDPQRDAQFNSSGYSPFPRHEAARGLLRLTVRQPDAEILDAVESLASDSVPSVRMIAAMELFRLYEKAPSRFWHIVDDRATHETNRVVQKYIYFTLAQVVARGKEEEDKTTRVMDKLLKHTPPPTERLEPADPFIDLLMWLAISRENPWALKTIEETFFKDPIQFANALNRSVFRVMKDYVTPKNLETPEGYLTARRAIAWLGKVIDVVSSGVQELCTTFKGRWTEEAEKKLHDTYKVIDEVIMRLYFEVAYERDQSEKPTERISDELRCRFYNEVKPLMEQVIAFALDEENGVMFAPTAHHFMQLLTSFLSCHPKEVLHLAESVARSSERFGYNLDSLAVADVVKFVETVLADHGNEVRDGQGLEDLLNLLDIFAKTGWSDALRLVWRLDEVFR